MRAIDAFPKLAAISKDSVPSCLRPSATDHTFPWKKAGLNRRSLRSDRILQEIYATGGDVRSICDPFGLSIGGASRYTATFGQPSFHEEIPVRRVRALSENVHDL